MKATDKHIDMIMRKYGLFEEPLVSEDEGILRSRNLATKKEIMRTKVQIRDRLDELRDVSDDIERFIPLEKPLDESIKDLKEYKEKMDELLFKLRKFRTKQKVRISANLRRAKASRDSFVEGLSTKGEIETGPITGSRVDVVDKLTEFLKRTFKHSKERKKIIRGPLSKEEQEEAYKEAVKEKMEEMREEGGG